MSNDARLGLMVGVGIVIAIALIFFRRDAGLPLTAEATAAVGVSKPAPLKPSAGSQRGVKAKATSFEIDAAGDK